MAEPAARSDRPDKTLATLEEAFIFKLGKMLGGRDEVLDAPAEEILKFMDMALEDEEKIAEKEKTDLFLQYLAVHFAQIPQGEESAERRNERDKFLGGLQPKGAKKKEFKWGNPELDNMPLLESKKSEVTDNGS